MVAAFLLWTAVLASVLFRRDNRAPQALAPAGEERPHIEEQAASTMIALPATVTSRSCLLLAQQAPQGDDGHRNSGTVSRQARLVHRWRARKLRHSAPRFR